MGEGDEVLVDFTDAAAGLDASPMAYVALRSRSSKFDLRAGRAAVLALFSGGAGDGVLLLFLVELVVGNDELLPVRWAVRDLRRVDRADSASSVELGGDVDRAAAFKSSDPARAGSEERSDEVASETTRMGCWASCSTALRNWLNMSVGREGVITGL